MKYEEMKFCKSCGSALIITKRESPFYSRQTGTKCIIVEKECTQFVGHNNGISKHDVFEITDCEQESPKPLPEREIK